nr:radical SAM protein [Treponema sp.]
MQKSKELPLDKKYNLKEYVIVPYENLHIAIFPEIASWILLKNAVQEKIFKSIADTKLCVQELMDTYKDKQSDLVYVLTQIEAKQIETLNPKSIFENKKLHLHLTNKCNLRCPHCYMESGSAEKNELTTKEIFKLIEDFKNVAGGTSVGITGGEPTVREDFFEIVEFINSIGMEVNVYTNGTNWTEKSVERFSKCKVKHVQVSIDGFDEESNAIIRGKGSFAKSLQAIDWFVKNGIYVKIATTAPFEILKDHKQDYIDFAKTLIAKHGKDNIQVNFSHAFMPGRNLTNEQIESFKDEYFNLVEDVVAEIVDGFEKEGFVLNVKGDLVDSCGYGSLNVRANGDFYFCDRIPDMKERHGNIRNMNFSEIFRLMKIAEGVGNIKNFKPCGDCELRFICGGGCRIAEFKGFSEVIDVENVDFSKIEPKECDEKAMKARYYKLMVDTNERFYK